MERSDILFLWRKFLSRIKISVNVKGETKTIHSREYLKKNYRNYWVFSHDLQNNIRSSRFARREYPRQQQWLPAVVNE